MPTHRLRTALSLLLFLQLAVTASYAQTRHALIIAIGDYPDPQNRGWAPISSLKDVEFIQTALEGQQFKKENINILRNAEASSAGITKALDDLAAKAKPGDVVVIHVSSHGVQIQDDEPDDEADLVDECIVTYGATIRMGKGGDNTKSRSAEVTKDLQYYYRDDLFGEKIDAIRTALGPAGDVLVLMDCCHSATATRGWEQGKQRGGIKPITFADFPELQARAVGAGKEKTPDVFADAPAKGRGAEADKATYVCISGARAEEQNFEVVEDGIGMGTLTYAVWKALSQLKEGTTYRGLFAQIEAIVQEKKGMRQHPVVEGSGLDRQIFGGVMTAQQPYVRIRTLKGPREMVLAEGSVSGLGEGAKVAVYPSGTADPGKATPLATGTISSATPHASTVALDADLSLGQTAKGWVFIREKVYAMEPISIGFEGFTKDEEKTMMTALAGNTLLRFGGAKPTMILVNGSSRDSLFQSTGEVFFKSMPDAVRNPLALEAVVQDYARYLLLRDLQQPFDDARVAVQLVPYSRATGVADTAGAARYRRAAGSNAVPVGDTVKVMVTNTSRNTVYVNILDLQPDGIISAVLPNTPKGVAPEALKLAPGETKIFPGGRGEFIRITPPLGAERFKVFSVVADNGDPLNMEAAATNNGVRGNLRAIEGLVNKSFSTRGTEMFTLPAEDAVRVDDYNFLIYDPRVAGD